ncbi:MAG: hypothetical protein ACON4Z_16960 [Planctomycetota bacterium]
MTATHDVTLLLGRELSAEERATALGIGNALRTAGLDVHHQTGRGASRIWLVAATQQEFAATRNQVATGSPVVALPMLRTRDELRGWSALLHGVQAIWSPSEEAATALACADTPALRIGPACELGRPSHRSRSTLGLREEDCVFVALLDSRTTERSTRMLREAWLARYSDLETRFSRVSLHVSTDDKAQHEDWLRFCDRSDICITTVELRDRDPWRLAAMAELGDCAIAFAEHSASGLLPSWHASTMLMNGKHVIGVGPCGLERLGESTPPNLHALTEGSADALGAAVAAVAEAHPAALGVAQARAKSLFLSCSARAVAVRCVESLRTVGLWDELASASIT